MYRCCVRGPVPSCAWSGSWRASCWLLADRYADGAACQNDPGVHIMPVERWTKRLAEEVVPLQVTREADFAIEYGEIGGDEGEDWRFL